MTAEHRSKIANSQILNRLIRHAEGAEQSMTATEVTAAISLLDRVLPKQKPVDEQGSSVDKQEVNITLGGD